MSRTHTFYINTLLQSFVPIRSTTYYPVRNVGWASPLLAGRAAAARSTANRGVTTSTAAADVPTSWYSGDDDVSCCLLRGQFTEHGYIKIQPPPPDLRDAQCIFSHSDRICGHLYRDRATTPGMY